LALYLTFIMEKAFIILTPPLEVYEQMAADEYFCEIMPRKYLLRFFNWAADGITFGFSQRHGEVLQKLGEEDRGSRITRRPTGGGIVFHRSDLTFSFIFYSPGDFNPYATYEKLHTAINEEYAAGGVPLKILNSRGGSYAVNNPVMDCFSKPVDKDLMAGGKKVLGGALRKFSDYMLYQASFQMEDSRKDSALHSETMTEALAKGYGLLFEPYSATENDLDKIRKLGYNKYRSREWIERI